MLTNLAYTLLGVIIGLIVGYLLFNIIIISFKQYRKYWEPIYKNRKDNFDKYLKYALNNSKESEPIENIASYAARMRIDSNFNKEEDYYRWKNHYLDELRSANIE